ncbi:MAG: IclR family transcriptional regulator [Acidobacteria bacterium]|nr:IclR family transcriptional regulator [Acidobacteriota bacterium]
MQNEFRTAEHRDPYIDVVGRVLKVAEALASEPDGLTLNELARRTGYVKSSVHRILYSLKRHGYVEQDGSRGAYKLGIQFAVLARGVKHSLLELARPLLRELLERFDETVYLAVLRDNAALFLDVQETRRDLRLVGPLDAQVHFHATAAGKAIAAFLPAERAHSLLNGEPLKQLTARTNVDPVEVRRDWAKVMRAGYATNTEETILGAIFLGAPVFDSRRMACASISIGVPKARYSAELGREMAGALMEACGRLSQSLGRTGYTHESQLVESQPVQGRLL